MRMRSLKIRYNEDDGMVDELGKVFGVSEPSYPNKPNANELTKEDVQRGFYFRTVNGNIIAFDVDTGEPVGGQTKALGNAKNGAVNAQNVGEQIYRAMNKAKFIDFSKDGWPITHFESDGRNLHFVKPLAVGFEENDYDPEYVIHKGDITNVIVFAADDYGDEVKIRSYLARTCGGSDASWEHLTGDAIVSSFDGKKYRAQVHFFESEDVGQTGWKVKRILGEVK